MESFYGGQQGFSFVVKGNPASDNGYFDNLNDINNAIVRGDLRYGDYAIVTGLTGIGNSYNSEHGDLYRINAKNQPERVANISHPALSTLIKGFNSFNNNVDVSQTASINFLDLNLSKQQSTLDLSWEYEEDNGVITGIRIGVKAPRPVVNIDVQQKQIDTSNPMAIASNQGIIQESGNSDNQPFYYDYQIQLPMRSILVSKGINIDTTNLDTGTLCFITSDIVGEWSESYHFFTRAFQTVTPYQAGLTPGVYFSIPFDMTEFNQFKILLPSGSNINEYVYQCQIVEYNKNDSVPTIDYNNFWLNGFFNTMQPIEQIASLPIFTDTDEKNRCVFLWIGAKNQSNNDWQQLASFKLWKIMMKE